MDAILDPFVDNAFMQRALVAGLLTVISTSVVGTWVVLRGLTFLGDALAHGVIPGIALAFLLEINLGVGAALAALVMLGGIDLVGRRSRLPQDVGIGLLFVGMLGLGVIIISLRGAYAGDLTAILFGDALGVSPEDVWTTAGVTVVVLAVAGLLHRPFLVLTFSREKADALGFRPRMASATMLVLVGMAIVASFRTVGTLLVFAFLVAPPAAASLVVRRVPVMMSLAVVLGWVAVVVGLLVSYHADTPASATVAVAAVIQFFLVLIVRGIVDGVRARQVQAATA